MVERLTLEEALLKNTRDNWIIVGRHAVWPPKHITIPHRKSFGDDSATTDNDKQHKHFLSKAIPGYIEGQRPNPQGMIVMGIGGKAQKLLNSRNVIDDQLLVVKRFSGGGTVVMDENAVWTTLIAGRRGTKEEEEDQDSEGHKNNILCKPYPRDIMKWTAEAVFGPAFDVLNANQTMRTTTTHSNNSSNDNNSNGDSNRLPRFSLREDDYVLTFGGDDDNREIRKMGGNAQAITGRQGWLHHTSFLWDYKDSNMERYLKLPEKRPNYRVDRSHKEFLVKLKEHYANEEGPSAFLEAMKEACQESLGLRETDWPSVYKEVFGGSDAEMNAWWLENRTRIQHEL
jgi:lipoate-protein ligase A